MNKKILTVIMLIFGLLIGGCMPQAANNDFIATVENALTSGWILDDETHTWTYDSADNPTFVASVNADMTAVLSPGMRIKLTQTTVKYFIVTAVGSYSGGATLITLYGGTDYTLANAAITSPAYSNVKAPFGFPLNPDKWTVEVTSDTTQSENSPTNGIWYNVGTNQINIPIGVWRVLYIVEGGVTTTSTSPSFKTTLSTSDSSETIPGFTRHSGVASSAFSNGLVYSSHYAEYLIVVLSKTTHYLLIKSDTVGVTKLEFLNASMDLIIRAVCAYL